MLLMKLTIEIFLNKNKTGSITINIKLIYPEMDWVNLRSKMETKIFTVWVVDIFLVSSIIVLNS